MADCDVAVVGAGVIGGAIACELIGRGASVTLLDARGAGLGSTQAAAGMLVPHIEGLGSRMLPMGTRSLSMYDEFIDRLSRDTGISIGYRRTGSLQVATADESAEELKALAETARAAGVSCQLLDARETLQAEPQLASDVVAGLLIPEHGFVVAGELSGALSAAAIKHGARLMMPARVRRLSQLNGTIDVELENDRVTARQVVVAAGSWSGQIEIDGVPSLPVRPVRGQLLQLAWTGVPLQRIAWGSRCYVVPVSPTMLLVGATVEEAGFDERATTAGVRDLLDSAADLVPHVWQAAFTAVRVGLRPASPDEMPIIGRSRRMPGVVYATGHYRNGILLAPLTARLVGDLVLDNREDPLLAETSPQRFGEY
jgi:glycine oxidase